MRVAALRQLQQELIQIEPAHQPLLGERRDEAVHFGAYELAGFAPPRPGEKQSLERPQHPAHRRFRAVCAAREQREPSVLGRKHLDDAARVAVGDLMQDIARG
jgi:hypothetical protein